MPEERSVHMKCAPELDVHNEVCAAYVHEEHEVRAIESYEVRAHEQKHVDILDAEVKLNVLHECYKDEVQCAEQVQGHVHVEIVAMKYSHREHIQDEPYEVWYKVCFSNIEVIYLDVLNFVMKSD